MRQDTIRWNGFIVDVFDEAETAIGVDANEPNVEGQGYVL